MKMAAKDKAGREELYAFVNKGKRGVIDLLFEFPSIEAELCHLIELVPRLQPRWTC
jgi:sulfite reductase alpha subunit-like flavoprotein